MDQQQIGSFIRQCREAKSLTQQQLADTLGVTNKAVSKWETGDGKLLFTFKPLRVANADSQTRCKSSEFES